MFTSFFDKKRWQSPNYNARQSLGGRSYPDMIILHYTGMKTANAALKRLCDPQAEVSAHYVIEENGRIHQLVEDNQRAWHAGKSYWEGLTDINSASIGIEIVNPGHEFGYKAFPDNQINALEGLFKTLVDHNAIPPHRILAHSDIAPDRKIDPGELFPWARLAASGFGLWPDPQAMDFEAATDLLDMPETLYALLVEYGYNPEVPPEILIEAFHRHYYPEIFAANNDPQRPDLNTAARLLSLIRLKNALIA
jgi:N-acetylmuramoyl-L-alanine amidase